MKFVTLNPETAFKQAIKASQKDTKLIVCGTYEDQNYIEEALQQDLRSPKEIIKAASSIEPLKWLETRREKLESSDIDLEKVTGTWQAESTAKQPFTLATDFATGETVDQLIGAKIKSNQSWKMPAHFKFGDWNSCPAAETHCALWKLWQQKYGAVIVGVSNDVIEAYITKPPTTPEQALELAWQQYLYCPDIVDQGVETVAKLAEVLLNHDCWFFWWD